MRVLFAGTPAVAVPSLDALIAAGFDVVAVLTRPDAPIGRKRVMTPSPVAQRAAERGIPVIYGARITPEVTELIRNAGADVAAIVAYGGLVPPAALAAPKHGWINLHFSLLPSWRGAAPVQRAIMAGDDVTGAVTFQLEEGLDTGPIFGTLTETVHAGDTAGELLSRLSHSGAVLLTQTLSALETGHAVALPQQGDVTLAPKLTLNDGRITWTHPAVAINRQIRGVTPEPGAWTEFAGQRLKVGPVKSEPAVTDLAPGVLRLDGKRVLVGTGSHAVHLVQIQPVGKKMMAAADWARGLASLESVVFE